MTKTTKETRHVEPKVSTEELIQQMNETDNPVTRAVLREIIEKRKRGH